MVENIEGGQIGTLSSGISWIRISDWLRCQTNFSSATRPLGLFHPRKIGAIAENGARAKTISVKGNLPGAQGIAPAFITTQAYARSALRIAR